MPDAAANCLELARGLQPNNYELCFGSLISREFVSSGCSLLKHVACKTVKPN